MYIPENENDTYYRKYGYPEIKRGRLGFAESNRFINLLLARGKCSHDSTNGKDVKTSNRIPSKHIVHFNEV